MGLGTTILTWGKRLIPGIAGAVQLYAGEPNPGWASVKAHLQNKAYEPAAYSAIANMTGLRMKHHGQRTTEFDVIGTLNPFDFRNAPTPKVILITRLAIEGIEAVHGFVSSLFDDMLPKKKKKKG